MFYSARVEHANENCNKKLIQNNSNNNNLILWIGQGSSTLAIFATRPPKHGNLRVPATVGSPPPKLVKRIRCWSNGSRVLYWSNVPDTGQRTRPPKHGNLRIPATVGSPPPKPTGQTGSTNWSNGLDTGQTTRPPKHGNLRVPATVGSPPPKPTGQTGPVLVKRA